MYLLRSEQRIRLILCTGVPVLLGLLTGILNIKAIFNVCKHLHKPPLTTPGFLMVLLWIICYIAIGLGTYLVWESHVYKEEKLLAFGTCGGQLLLHTFWVMIFFNSKVYLLACFIHLLYFALVLLNTALYFKIEKRAGYLLLPSVVLSLYYTYISIAVIFIN